MLSASLPIIKDSLSETEKTDKSENSQKLIGS